MLSRQVALDADRGEQTRRVRAPEAQHVAVALVLDDAPTVGVRRARATGARGAAARRTTPRRRASTASSVERFDVAEDDRQRARFVARTQHVRVQVLDHRVGDDLDRGVRGAGSAGELGVRDLQRREPRCADLDASVPDHDDGALARRRRFFQRETVEDRSVRTPEVADDHAPVRPGFERDVATGNPAVDDDDTVALAPELDPPVDDERERLTVRRAHGGDGMVHAAPAWQAGTLPDSTQMLILPARVVARAIAWHAPSRRLRARRA